MKIPIIVSSARIADDDRNDLAKLFAQGSLYKRLDIPGAWKAGDSAEHVLPSEIQRECESDKCVNLGALSWTLDQIQNAAPGACTGVLYKCRNCGAPFHVWFSWRFTPSKVARDIQALNKALQLGMPLFLQSLRSVTSTLRKRGSLRLCP